MPAIRFVKRLRHSKAGRNFGASIFAFISTSAYGLLSIPIAVHYLTKEELGLWATAGAMVAYLMLMDMGVGGSTGRKIANAIITKDPAQINIWWTATQLALWTLGGLTMLIGLCLTPVFISLYNIPSHLSQDAWMLFVGTTFFAAVNLPLRGVPGLLTAQERFHWVPICQGIAPWVQLVVFYLMLKAGYGLKSYIFGSAAIQLFCFIYYRVLIATSPIRPRYDRKGVTRAHFKELFGFSLNVAIIGLKDTILNTLPVTILARAAGLQSVPVYTFSNRLPGMLRSLSMRVNHAFLPEQINLHIAGEHGKFLYKFRLSLLLASSLAIAAAAFTLLLNRSVVTIIAGPDFYASDQVTAWFSLMLVVATISSVYQSLLQISGNMGKSIPFSIANVLIMLVAAPASYKMYGMAGLAAAFALQPIVFGIYGLVRGARNCGYKLKEFMNLGMVASIISIAAVIVIGCFMDSSNSIGDGYVFYGRKCLMPSMSQIICSSILLAVSGVLAFYGFKYKNNTN